MRTGLLKTLRTLGHVHRWTWWVVGALLLLLVIAHLSLRFWLLPQVPGQRAQIEKTLSEAIQRPVRIDAISAEWTGISPEVGIQGFHVLDREGREALVLPTLTGAISWRSLFAGTLVLGELRTSGLELFLRRDAEGTILLADIPLNRGEDNRFSDWLLQQRGVLLERSVLHWDDQLRAAPRLTLRNVEVSLQNRGDRHRFSLKAVPAVELATPLEMQGEWNGPSLDRIAEGSGFVSATLERVDVAAWHPWLDLPFGITRGRGGVSARLEVQGERVTGIAADLELTEVHARLRDDLPQLDIEALAGHIAVVNRPAERSLELRNLTLRTRDGVVAPETTLNWQQTGTGPAARNRARIDHLMLRPMFLLIDSLPLDDAIRDRIRQAAPRGELRDVEAQWQGDAATMPTVYAVKGRFAALGMAPVDGIPGVDNLDGRLDADQRGGSATLSVNQALLLWPETLARAMPVKGLRANLDWKRAGKDWNIALTSASLDTGEFRAKIKGRYLTAGKGQIEGSAVLEQFQPGAVVHYLPLSVNADTRDWFATAFPGGGSGTGEATLSGEPGAFPYVGGRGGRFEARLQLRKTPLRFSSDWPDIDIDAASLRFDNSRFTLDSATGRTRQGFLSAVRAVIPDLDASDPVLDVSGQIGASVPEVLEYIRHSPVRELINGATDNMGGQGNTTLKLALHVPLNHSVQTTVRGDLTLRDNRLELGRDRPVVTALTGSLGFTEQGIFSQSLTGELLGGAFRAAVRSESGGIVHIEGGGRSRIAALSQQFPSKLWGVASGEMAYRAELVIAPTETRLQVRSGLEGVTLDLPDPLRKVPAANLPTRFLWAGAGVVDRYELAIGSQLRLRLQSRDAPAGSAIEQVHLALGPAALPDDNQRGVWANAELPQFFVSRWLPMLERLADSTGEARGAPLPARVRLRTPRLEAEGRFFNDIDLTAERRSRAWDWKVRGSELEGSGQWDPSGRGSVTARLSRLLVPPAVDSLSAPDDDAPDSYPALDIEIGRFERNGKDLGSLRLRATQQGRDWRIDQLRLAADEYRLEATGVWEAWRSRPTTSIKVELTTTDSGKYLERLGFGSLLKGGGGSLKGDLHWRGAPGDLDYASLGGELKLDLGKGQFLKAEPGVARLLGIVSLQSLPRRITLDFRDVFSEGLGFDRIDGEIAVADGVMRTKDLFIDGPAAKVRIKGQADVARETQDLQVRVSPAMDAATVGALVANPIAGLAVFVLQELLDDPLGKLITFSYKVTGTWADPVVAKLGAPEVQKRDDSAKNRGGMIP